MTNCRAEEVGLWPAGGDAACGGGGGGIMGRVTRVLVGIVVDGFGKIDVPCQARSWQMRVM
jgi:hypothetical protein